MFCKNITFQSVCESLYPVLNICLPDETHSTYSCSLSLGSSPTVATNTQLRQK